MPYGWIDPDVFVEHNGVPIYHVYKDNDIDAGPRSYWFTTDLSGGDCDDPCAFDVRDLSTYAEDKPFDQAIREAIDKKELRSKMPWQRK